jgi:hypothetical protein
MFSAMPCAHGNFFQPIRHITRETFQIPPMHTIIRFRGKEEAQFTVFEHIVRRSKDSAGHAYNE